MRRIASNIYAVGAIDWDTRLFDRLIPLPDGTSYNSYLVVGSEKTALVDTVDPAKTDVLMRNLDELKVKRIDYLIANHAEQDHSGSLGALMERYPDAMLVTNPKCQGMLMDLLHLCEDRFIEIVEGDELSLGDKTMRFVYLPWVHWPETMGTYLTEDKMLFSCDFFGAHFACSSVFVDDEAAVHEAAKRYYAEIMMPFRRQIRSNLAKLAKLDIRMIAPSHGPVYDHPEFIVKAYEDWTSDVVKNEVVVAYVSMHGSTAAMVSHLVDALMERGIKVRQFELSTVDSGRLAIGLVDAATIVIGSPTVMTGAHPCAAHAAFLANAIRPKVKFATIIGSYGWAGKTVEQLVGMLTNLKAEILEPVMIKGCPTAEGFAELDRLADDILAKHKAIGIAK